MKKDLISVINEKEKDTLEKAHLEKRMNKITLEDEDVYDTQEGDDNNNNKYNIGTVLAKKKESNAQATNLKELLAFSSKPKEFRRGENATAVKQQVQSDKDKLTFNRPIFFNSVAKDIINNDSPAQAGATPITHIDKKEEIQVSKPVFFNPNYEFKGEPLTTKPIVDNSKNNETMQPECPIFKGDLETVLKQSGEINAIKEGIKSKNITPSNNTVNSLQQQQCPIEEWSKPMFVNKKIENVSEGNFKEWEKNKTGDWFMEKWNAMKHSQWTRIRNKTEEQIKEEQWEVEKEKKIWESKPVFFNSKIPAKEPENTTLIVQNTSTIIPSAINSSDINNENSYYTKGNQRIEANERSNKYPNPTPSQNHEANNCNDNVYKTYNDYVADNQEIENGYGYSNTNTNSRSRGYNNYHRGERGYHHNEQGNYYYEGKKYSNYQEDNYNKEEHRYNNNYPFNQHKLYNNHRGNYNNSNGNHRGYRNRGNFHNEYNNYQNNYTQEIEDDFDNLKEIDDNFHTSNYGEYDDLDDNYIPEDFQNSHYFNDNNSNYNYYYQSGNNGQHQRYNQNQRPKRIITRGNYNNSYQ